MTTLGVVFRPQLPPEQLRPLVRLADAAGVEELWLWEDCFLESGIAAASAALAWTERLHVGVGLLPVPLRNVALASMEAATLYRLFPERVTLAVGHGVQDWMGQVGARPDSPLTLLREYLGAMRSLLRGEEVSADGEYVRLDKVALDWPPHRAPAVFAGGVGPRTLRLTGEAADGTVLDASTSPDGMRAARRLIEEGRAAAGRDADAPHKVVVYLLAATGPGAADRVRAELASDRRVLSPELGAAGDAEAVAAAVRELAAAGADTVVLQPTADEPDPAGFVRFVAEEVRGLVP
ncbi:LLM class flavin-dependent oxidoreductase [Streptomyces sp. NPDC004111]|uniref:LLM class flavin-dependent oxidoreductase n=1 Tax=Streptomyces sp. NPDC004111 TaxID=3364690 RepID=UPI0036A96B38